MLDLITLRSVNAHQQSAKEATIRMDTERIREAADEMNSGGTPHTQAELGKARLMLEKEKTT